jgi:opacity protein-like surface antigen
MGGEWMTGKFATTSAPPLLLLTGVLTILLGAQGFAQTAPAGQTPAPQSAPAPSAQQPTAQPPATAPPASGQEPADEESTSRLRKKRPHDYKNWNFNVGAGANLDSGTTRSYVRGGGFVASAGAARNANKYLGLRADFFFANLPLRDSTLQLAQATGATTHAYSLTLDPIINIPVSSKYRGYVLFGPVYTHRSGSLDSSTAVPGSACNGFWTWWGACSNVSIPLSGDFIHSSQNEFGYNFGGGVAVKVPSGAEIYAEYRFMHGSSNGITTDFRPITIGFRW